jgi:hypothetical protein
MSRGDDSDVADEADEPVELKTASAEPTTTSATAEKAVAPATAPAAAAAETLEVDDSDSEEGSDDESEDGFIDGLDKVQAEGVEPCKMVRRLACPLHVRAQP